MKREAVDDRYKWDLTCYIKDDKMLNDELNFIKQNYVKYKDFYNRFNDKVSLLEYFKFDDEFSKRLDKLYCYVFHSLDVDKSNTKFIKLKDELGYIGDEISQATSFISPQLLDLNEEYLKEVYNDKDFETYKRTIEDLIRNKPHKLSEHDNGIISQMGLFLGGTSVAFDIMSSGEMTFDSFVVDGKTYNVDEANYSKLLNNDNREVRKNTLKSLMTGYGKFNKTITSLYLNDIQEDVFFSKLHKFNSIKEECLFEEEVSPNVYNKLINQVNNNLPLLHKIVDEKRKALNLNEIAYYDLMVENKERKEEYSVEDAINLVLKAVQPLGEEYLQIVGKKFKEKTIDFMPNDNKETGAYSSGCYGCPSVILMNFVGDLKSVYTLAHEMGHSMHSELSNKYQPYSTSQYEIFVAEVASTVNEILLYHQLINTADDEMKKSLVYDIFDEFRATVFRQTMFSEFEDWIHKELENKNPKTYEDLNDFYYNLNKKYYGNNIILPDELKYEWSRIPHFYRPFYVYKYATGFLSAICIVENILRDKEYYKKYTNFLKSGSSKDVVQLLRDIDVDLETDEPYKRAFAFLEKQLNLLK